MVCKACLFMLSAQRCLNRYCTERCEQDGIRLLCLFFLSPLLQIFVYLKPFFMRRVVALMGMYPLYFFYLRFSTFKFHDFPFVYSYLIKPFDSERKYPVLFFRLNREVPGSLVFFLTVRGLGLCDVIPLSTRVTSLFEFPDCYLCIRHIHGYAKHPNLFPEGPQKEDVTCL